MAALLKLAIIGVVAAFNVVAIAADDAAVEISGLNKLTSTQLKHWDFRLDCSGQLPCRAFAANLDQAAFLQSSPVGSTIDTPEDLAARNYSDRNLANSVVRMATDGVQALGEQHDHAHKVPVGTSKQTHVMQRCFSSCPRVQEQDIDHPLNTMITIDAMCKKLCIKTTQQVAQQMTPDGPSSAKSIDYPIFDPPCPKLAGMDCNGHGVCDRGVCKCDTNYTHTDVCLPVPAPKIEIGDYGRRSNSDPKGADYVWNGPEVLKPASCKEDKDTWGHSCTAGVCTCWKTCGGKGKELPGGICECTNPMFNGVNPETGVRDCRAILPPAEGGGSQVYVAGMTEESGTFRGYTDNSVCQKPPACFGVTPCVAPFAECLDPSSKKLYEDANFLAKGARKVKWGVCNVFPNRAYLRPLNGLIMWTQRVVMGYYKKPGTNMNGGHPKGIKLGGMLRDGTSNYDGLGCDAEPCLSIKNDISKTLLTELYRHYSGAPDGCDFIYGDDEDADHHPAECRVRKAFNPTAQQCNGGYKRKCMSATTLAAIEEGPVGGIGPPLLPDGMCNCYSQFDPFAGAPKSPISGYLNEKGKTHTDKSGYLKDHGILLGHMDENGPFMRSMLAISEIVIDSPVPMPANAGDLAGLPRGRQTAPKLYDVLIKYMKKNTGQQGERVKWKEGDGFMCSDHLLRQITDGTGKVGPGFKQRLTPDDYSPYEELLFGAMGVGLNGATSAGQNSWSDFKLKSPSQIGPKMCTVGKTPFKQPGAAKPFICCNPKCPTCGDGGTCNTPPQSEDKAWAEANCCKSSIFSSGRTCDTPEDTSCKLTVPESQWAASSMSDSNGDRPRQVGELPGIPGGHSADGADAEA